MVDGYEPSWLPTLRFRYAAHKSHHGENVMPTRLQQLWVDTNDYSTNSLAEWRDIETVEID